MNQPLDGFDVVLVEDDEDSRTLFEFALAQEGARVRAASTADEALGLLRARRPDVLVTDIGMPGTNGYVLLQQARVLHPDLPAIAVTGYAARDDAQRLADAGYQHHLTKPVEIADLVAAVFRFASRSRSED